MSAVIIVGTGDHARVVVDLARAAGHEISGMVEPDAARLTHADGQSGAPILGSLESGNAWMDAYRESAFVVAIGANDVRQRAYERCLELGLRPIALVHPSAAILGGATVGPGAQACAMAMIGVSARIDANVIVNSMASVDHDAVIEAHAFIGPGARLAGRVRVGAGAHVGIGAVVREGIMIGRGAFVAAGAVVVADVAPGARVAGVPARLMDSDPMEGNE
ncbi:MAG: NeuD/PglB/VioB family sugar acetyltransferase [Candidatus Limnocylindria bacterium]